MPTFALERAQEILYVIRGGIATGRIKPSVQVFLDLPMAISATEIFERHPECYGPGYRRAYCIGAKIHSMFRGFILLAERRTMAINRIIGGAIIIAGSGMCYLAGG